ncbi:MAG: ribonuclease III [Candidatus Binatia bacterium]
MTGETAGAPSDGAARTSLASRLGVTFSHPGLLDLALTHRSYASEFGLEGTNERLEFLGDAILNLCITDLIYAKFPLYLEGDLAKLRASMVSEPALAEVASELDLGDDIRLGRGERLSGGHSKPSIMADTLEAVIGAIYLDRGIREVRRVVKALFGSRVEDAVGKEVPKDAKTRLQEFVTRRYGNLPRYRTVGHGPDHAKQFLADVYVNEHLYGRGEGRSKKEAEQAAAAQALEELESNEAANA